jgi:hypothetical protein
MLAMPDRFNFFEILFTFNPLRIFKRNTGLSMGSEILNMVQRINEISTDKSINYVLHKNVVIHKIKIINPKENYYVYSYKIISSRFIGSCAPS